MRHAMPFSRQQTGSAFFLHPLQAVTMQGAHLQNAYTGLS
jgi:hypothetical protein